MKFIDMSGMRFGRVTVVGRVDMKTRPIRWTFICDCGQEGAAGGGDLRSGKTQSCGCLRKERIRATKTTHGKSGARIYLIWASMIKRCHNPKDPSYDRYGGRGIKVCERWRNSFEAFLSDVGERPSAGLTLDRIDGTRGYEPGNIQWSTPRQQNLNREYRKRDARYKEIVALLEQGLTQAEVRARLGVGNQAIWRAIRAHGFVMSDQIRATRSAAQADRMRRLCEKKYGKVYGNAERDTIEAEELHRASREA